MRRSGTGTVSATGVDVSFKAVLFGRCLDSGAAFFQAAIVRVFAEKDFIHMRRCRDEFVVSLALLAGYLFHNLIF